MKIFLNPLPNYIILGCSELKALADHKMKWKIKIVFGRIENILGGKGENAGYQHFLLFPKCFQKPPFSAF